MPCLPGEAGLQQPSEVKQVPFQCLLIAAFKYLVCNNTKMENTAQHGHFSGVYPITHLVRQPCCPCSPSWGHGEGSQDEATSGTVMLPQSYRALAG